MIPNLPYQYIPHSPTDKQYAALCLQNTLEVFYGGAAGGGKTDWLLMEALLYVNVPGYSGILFRESFPNLSHEPDGLMPRLASWLQGTGARWAGSTRTWHFPSSATLTFGYLYKPDDHFRYAGPSYQFIGVDEGTEIRSRSYQFMFSRLRRLQTSPIPLRMRVTSNPGGRSHGFFRDRFNLTEGGRNLGPDRAYIGATITDNPYLDKAEYEKALSQLSPVDRARLLSGDWSVNEEGAIFKRHWFPIVNDYPHSARTIRYWDLAGSEQTGSNDPDWTVGVKMAWDGETFYVADVIRLRATTGTVKQTIRQAADLDGPNVEVCFEEEPGSAGIHFLHELRRLLADRTVRSVRHTGSKVMRAGPVSSAAEAGNVRMVRGRWNDDFLEEVSMFDDVDHDDQVDALSGAHLVLTRRGQWGAR